MNDLPDLSFGLKAGQRRILQALAKKTRAGRPGTMQSASLLRAVLGGPVPSLERALVSALAETGEIEPYLSMYLELVGMVQPFQARYPLVEGIGNFGTVDGDPPADAVFTRCRLSPFGVAAAAGMAPSLMVNGAAGSCGESAVRFLPHHLGEVIAAARRLIQDPSISDEALAALIPGPDFPTGGLVSSAELRPIYLKGEGSLRVRGKVMIIGEGSQRALLVTELPFTVWKSSLIEELVKAVDEGWVEGIADIADESDPHGIRIRLALGAGASPARVLEELFARTCLEIALPVHMLALVGGVPRQVSLADLVRAYVAQLREQTTAAQGHPPTSNDLLRDLEALALAHRDERRTTLQ